MYKQSKDETVAPTVKSYNTLLNAWSKSYDPTATVRAEAILEEMLAAVEEGRDDLRPDAVTFSTVMDVYARSKNRNKCQRCEQIFKMMDDLDVRRNVFTFSALQNVYARSGMPDAAEKTRAVLDQMLDLYHRGDVFAKPTCLHYNAVLHALSRSNAPDQAKTANEMLEKMERSVADGGYDVDPDRMSFALAILACARCRDKVEGARLAEKNLEKMESRAQLEADRRAAVSSVAPPLVSLDVECFNVALTAISRSRQNDACERTLQIIRRMEEYAEKGQPELRPNIRSWNAVLNAFSRAPNAEKPDFAAKVEDLLDHIFSLHMSGISDLKPNAFTFAAVLSTYQKCGDKSAAERADRLVRQMEELYEAGAIDAPPDVYHYTILCSTWAKSYHPLAPERCIQILSHMTERHSSGYPSVKPTVRTYNAVLDCLCRVDQTDRAEELLYHMLRLFKLGDADAGPDCFSFNRVIRAYCRSKEKGSGKKAEAILERFLEYQQEENASAGPDTRSFGHIILYYARSRGLDSPYRTEYLLNRMLSLFIDGQKSVEPNGVVFSTVIESYAYSKHTDAGRNADRLVRQMRKLQVDYPNLDLGVSTDVMNSVLFAWASCGDDDAGRHAESYLDEMERLCQSGDHSICPDTKSYQLVLSAWSKSNTFDKAPRALRVLRRMMSNPTVEVGEHAYSLVVNTCAFSNASVEAEREAFSIAVDLLDEMFKSDALHPRPLTYGWFIQACGRLRVPKQQKQPQLTKWFQRCCQDGFLNEFVLRRFRGAAPEPMFEALVVDNLLPSARSRKRSSITVRDLPSSWSSNTSKT